MIFLDTGFLFALLHKGDQYHEAALQWKDIVESGQLQLITTEFCLIELVNHLSAMGKRQLARDAVQELDSSAFVKVIPCSSRLFQKGLELHARRDDKTWSLTDCISFVVMEEQGVTEALGFDQDFVQAGIRVLTLEE